MKERQSPAGTGPHPNTRINFTTAFGPRHRRLLQSLLRGPITREQADKIARASNAPHWISQLRACGLDIPCRRVKRKDSDGCWVYPGTYSLARESVPLARHLLEGVSDE